MSSDTQCATTYLERRLASFEIDTYMKQYADPQTAFTGRRPSTLYRLHLDVFLKHKFPFMAREFVELAMANHERLHEAYKFLVHAARQGKVQYTVSDLPTDMPNDVDVEFYDELLYVMKKEEIDSIVEISRFSLEDRHQAAMHAGELVSCMVCFDDMLPEQKSLCPYGHVFCHNCIQASMEVALGQGRQTLRCLKCPETFSMETLEAALKPYTVSALRRRMREDYAASTPGFQACPYCLYLCDVTEVEDNICICPNLDCLRSSCRLCRGPDHSGACPTKEAPSLHTYLMGAVSTAVLLHCSDCGVVLDKDGGCNLITCTCGAAVCYLCGQQITGYDHYDDPESACENALFKDAISQRHQSIREAVLSAQIEYYELYPGTMQDVDIDDFLSGLEEWRAEEEPGPRGVLLEVEQQETPEEEEHENEADETEPEKKDQDEKYEEDEEDDMYDEEDDDDDDDEDYGYYNFE